MVFGRDYVTGEMAEENLTSAERKMKSWFDRHVESSVYSPGHKVLALLPVVNSPF